MAAARQEMVVDAPPTEWIGTGKDEAEIAKEVLAFLATLTKDQKIQRVAGNYFSFMEDIWDNATTAPINAADFESIRRNQSQGYVYHPLCCSSKKFIDSDDKHDAAEAINSQDNNELRMDAYGASDCPEAHLLCCSHADDSCEVCCHKAFCILAEACVGRKVGHHDDDFDDVTMPTTDAAAAAPAPVGPRRRTRNPPKRFTDPGPSSKKQKTKPQIVAQGRLRLLNGINGHKYNKMYFKGQGTYYDTEHPSVLVIPLLSFQEIMDWGKEGHQTPYDVLTITFGRKRIRAGKLLTLALDECSTEEIVQARGLLETFVKGVAGSLLNKDIEENFEPSDYKTNSSLAAWHQLVARVQDKSQSTIGIPGAKQLPGRFHVAKSRLSRGNALPDPWLVMIKAAINYSSFRNTRLMPACLPESVDDGEMNTSQGQELYVKDNVDHAAELALSLQRGGTSIEMFSAD